MLDISGLQKSFDGFMAVADARLTAEKGAVVAVIGPNGAGKTTLFHLITGQLAPDRGEITFKGKNIAGLPPHEICRRGISRSYQVVNLFDRLTVFENVQVAVFSRRRQTWNLFASAGRMAVNETERILDHVGLGGQGERIAGTLSHGDRKVLEIAVALGNRPELLILDEPTAGMSPEETARTMALLKTLSEEMGITLVFCEHDMELVFGLAHSIMVMHQGRTLIQDAPDAVAAHPEVRSAYLGEE